MNLRSELYQTSYPSDCNMRSLLSVLNLIDVTAG